MKTIYLTSCKLISSKGSDVTKMIVEVTLLDGTVVKYDMDAKGKGLELLEKVADQLQLIEKDYFGFLIVDHRDKTLTWLQNDRKLNQQLKEDHSCIFQVKSDNFQTISRQIPDKIREK